MTNVLAIFKKQIKDTLKNRSVLIQFIMFPLLTVVMQNAIQMQGMPGNYFVNLFAVMFLGMSPLTSMAAIISEEKEKNTLRVLMMSNVKPHEYLIGIGGYIWLICMLGSGVFCLTGGYQGSTALIFLSIMAIGILVSLLIGAAIGTWSQNQMMATSITVPIMMIFSFLPMLSMFNTTIAEVAKFTYSQQISLLLNQVTNLHIDFMNIGVIGLNTIVALILFILAYRKCGLS